MNTTNLKDSLQLKISEPLRESPHPPKHSKAFLVWENFKELQQLREKSKTAREKGLPRQYTWAELAELFSESSGEPITEHYLRKLYYAVGKKYFQNTR
ncbi:hypothetical protein IQ255_07735 [Pleurocapsales cyanobacterium LEGE 10410]|nr:hypothetical protein [Pleurocapsales cyanobacterium LEGE 10410]